MVSYLEQSLAQIKEFEGVVPWMYLDTVGKVTVGVGLMLVSEVAAHALPFLSGERAATVEEIGRDFLRVSAMKKGQLASFYTASNGLRLPADVIDERLRGALIGFEGYLRSHMAGYDSFPDAAKLALLDMSYNLGPGRFFSEYGRLVQAVERGDWKGAAAASARRGPSAARNRWTRQQFLAAGVDLRRCRSSSGCDHRRSTWSHRGLASLAARILMRLIC